VGQGVAISLVGPPHYSELCYGDTPFSLVYGSEAMSPTELEHKSFWVQHFNEECSDDSRVDDLTKLEELREATVI
jgi:hypothetical protein